MIWRDQLALRSLRRKTGSGHRPSSYGESVFTTSDHRELLDRKDIDAVVIATPDHWHVPITIDACEAGKDIYCEKPMTHKLEESQRILEVKERTGKVIQVTATPDVGRAHSARPAGLHELLGHLAGSPDRHQVVPVRGVEPDSVGDGDLVGGLAGAHPLVHGGGQRDAELGSQGPGARGQELEYRRYPAIHFEIQAGPVYHEV